LDRSALIYAKALVAGAWLLSLAAGCSKSPTVDSAAATAELIEIVVGPRKLVRLKETARTNRTSTVLIERGTSGSPTQDTFLIVDAIASSLQPVRRATSST
jgi:hypothetical protein